jgi:hypothetical protein
VRGLRRRPRLTQVGLEEVIGKSKNLRACSGRDRLASALNHFVWVPIVQFAEGGLQVGLCLSMLSRLCECCLIEIGLHCIGSGEASPAE